MLRLKPKDYEVFASSRSKYYKLNVLINVTANKVALNFTPRVPGVKKYIKQYIDLSLQQKTSFIFSDENVSVSSYLRDIKKSLTNFISHKVGKDLDEDTKNLSMEQLQKKMSRYLSEEVFNKIISHAAKGHEVRLVYERCPQLDKNTTKRKDDENRIPKKIFLKTEHESSNKKEKSTKPEKKDLSVNYIYKIRDKSDNIKENSSTNMMYSLKSIIIDEKSGKADKKHKTIQEKQDKYILKCHSHPNKVKHKKQDHNHSSSYGDYLSIKKKRDQCEKLLKNYVQQESTTYKYGKEQQLYYVMLADNKKAREDVKDVKKKHRSHSPSVAKETKKHGKKRKNRNKSVNNNDTSTSYQTNKAKNDKKKHVDKKPASKDMQDIPELGLNSEFPSIEIRLSPPEYDSLHYPKGGKEAESGECIYYIKGKTHKSKKERKHKR